MPAVIALVRARFVPMRETLPKRFAAVKEIILEIAVYSELVRRVLSSLHIEAAQLAGNIGKSQRMILKRCAADNKPGRSSLETMKALVEMEDPRLAADIQKALDVYKWHSKPRSIERDALLAVIAEFRDEFEALSRKRHGLDKSVILRDVLRSGITAQNLKIRGELQAESEREGQERVQRGKQAK